MSRVVWYDRIGSTNVEVARRAAQGADAGLLVLADEQVAGRGRLDRRWTAPPGTSLMASLLLRPARPLSAVTLLPLLVGLALVEACEPLVGGARLDLKWPNDLLADGRKCAGILVEAPRRGVVVVGVGVNVDWRRVARPDELATAISLTEIRGAGPVDRWRLLSDVVARIDQHVTSWHDEPAGFLPAYRDHCATLGARVRVDRVDGATLEGDAVGVSDAGALLVDTGAGVVDVHAGDVHHLRHR